MSPRPKATITERPDVVYVLPNKFGGVFNVVNNLLDHRVPDGLSHRAVLTENPLSRDEPASESLSADRQAIVTYQTPRENLYAALRRVREAVGNGPGLMVANDWIELAMVSAYDIDRTIVSITHGDSDYYYGLARIHEPWIDCFVALTRKMEHELLKLMPHRADSIFRIPYGVEIHPLARVHAPLSPIRLLYVGRIDRQKGVFDLPVIDAHLERFGVRRRWTIQGAGPDAEELRAAWRAPGIRWAGLGTAAEVQRAYREHDVLVMPSRSEGLPVVLLEGAASGIVPVVSDLPSGIPEVVQQNWSGFLIPVGHTQGFANAIASLDADRALHEKMSRNARVRVAADFDIAQRAGDYQALYSRWAELRTTPRAPRRLAYGSRLDKRWLPNALVRFLRGVPRL